MRFVAPAVFIFPYQIVRKYLVENFPNKTVLNRGKKHNDANNPLYPFIYASSKDKTGRNIYVDPVESDRT